MQLLKKFWQQLSSIFKFLWWIITDTVEDVKFIVEAIKKYRRGEKILDPIKVAQFRDGIKGITVGSMLRESWHWILVIAFAFVMGWILGGARCEVLCNNFIIENYVMPQMEINQTIFSNLTLP